MAEDIFCLDTSVYVKLLTEEGPAPLAEAAERLIRRALGHGRIVAPAFAWAELGSVLRKKTRQQLLRAERAEAAWSQFRRLPVEYVEVPALKSLAWDIARRYSLPTLYDAAFLACTELVPAAEDALREFWTADEELLRSLAADRPPYVHQLGR